MKSALIVMPAHNVGKTIAELLERMKKYQSRMLIINDGSTDNTAQIIRAHGCQMLENSQKMGVSYSISKGILWAEKNNYDKVILMDADGQHDPIYIPMFDSYLLEYDFVYGERFLGVEYVPSVKLASNLLAVLLTSRVFGSEVYDVACGFKGFVLNKGIQNRIDIAQNYSIVYDILFYSLSKGLKIKSVQMNAIYFANELWYTRTVELLALIGSLCRFSDKGESLEREVLEIKRAVEVEEDFYIRMKGYEFWGYSIREKKGYIIQSQTGKLQDYVERKLLI